MQRPEHDPSITTRMPREELLALLGRSIRGEERLSAAAPRPFAEGDRPAPIVVHRARISAWLARKEPRVGEGSTRHAT